MARVSVRNTKRWLLVVIAMALIVAGTGINAGSPWPGILIANVGASAPTAISPASVIKVIEASGPTEVSGSIGVDTVWGPQGSPYVVQGVLGVPYGVTLTLLPGTVVHFSGPDSGMLVGGQLQSLGTPHRRVTFTSAKEGAGAAPGDWGTIKFPNGHSGLDVSTNTPVSVFDYTDIKFGGYTQDCDNPACRVEHIRGAVEIFTDSRVVISNSSLTDSKSAALIVNSLYPMPDSYAGIYNSTFDRSAYGIYTFGSAAQIVGNTFGSGLTERALFVHMPWQVRMQWNLVNGVTTVSGGTTVTRAQADTRFNYLVGGINNYIGAPEDDPRFSAFPLGGEWTYNWWGKNVNVEILPPCATQEQAIASNPRLKLDLDQPCSPASQGYKVVGHLQTVKPAMSRGLVPIPPSVLEASAPTFGPVNTASGALRYAVTDLSVHDAGKQLAATRAYRSDSDIDGDLGKGWRTAYTENVSPGTEGPSMGFSDGTSVPLGIDPAAGNLPGPGVSAAYTSDATGTTVTSPGQTSYQFNPAGELTQMTMGDPGHKVTVQQSSGQVNKVTGSSGRYVEYTRADGKVSEVKDSTGRAVNFTYDGGRLTADIGVDGKTTRYGYDGSGRLSSVTTPMGRTRLAAGYDSQGRVSWLEQQGSGRTSFEYQSSQGRTTATLANGTVIDHDYDSSGRLVTEQVRSGSGRHVVYDGEGRIAAQISGIPTVPMTGFAPSLAAVHYDGNGDPVATVDPDGRAVFTTFTSKHKPLVTTYVDSIDNSPTVRRTYDDDGRLATLTDTTDKVWKADYNDRGQPVKITDPLDRTSTTTYETNGDRSVTTDFTGASTHYAYDSQGRVTAVTDPVGKTRSTVHTAWDQPAKVTSPRGGTEESVFDEDRNILTNTDQLNRVTRYDYDTQGRVVTITDPAGGVTGASYDELGRPVEVTDARGSVTKRTYSSEGWVTSVTDAADATTLFGLDPAGRPYRVTDALGQVTQRTYTKSGLVVRVETPDGSVRRYGLDNLGRVVKDTDALGRAWEAAYDAAGRQTWVFDRIGAVNFTYDDVGRLATKTDQEGAKTTYAYDDAARTVTVADPLGVVSKDTFDGAGRRKSTEDGLGAKSLFGYDDDGNLAEQTTPEGDKTVYVYDLAGNLQSQTDPTGRSITATYDALDRIQVRTYPGGSTEDFTYDAAGNLIRRVDRTGAAWTYEFDAVNRPTSSADPLGNTTTYVHDKLGRRTSVTDAMDATQETAYDPVGRPAVITDAAGANWVTTYDEVGNALTVTDPAGLVQRFTYDAGDRIRTAIAPKRLFTYTYDKVGRLRTLEDESMASTKRTWEYDGRGRRVAEVDTAGNRTAYDFDLADNLIKTTTPSGKTQTWTYDHAGRLTTAVDGLGNASRYDYDPADRLTQITLPRGGAYALTYDEDGRVGTEIDPIGKTTAYTYDGEGRNTSTVFPSGRSVTTSYDLAGQLTARIGNDETRRYEYDPAGRMTSAVDDSSRLTYAYDSRGLLASSTDSRGTTDYTFDAAMRLTAVQQPDAPRTEYIYDTDTGFLEKVAGGGATSIAYKYDQKDATSYQTGGLLTNKYPTESGVKGLEERTYDAERRLTGIKESGIFGFTATYNPDGQTAQLTRTLSPLNNPASGTTGYEYDDAGRLSKETLTDRDGKTQATTYGWDADGNRTSVQTGDQSPITAEYDAAGRLRGTSDGATYDYNAEGTLTRAVAVDGTDTTLIYNCFGELISVQQDGLTVDYTRDPLGRQASRSSSGTTETFSYDATSTDLAGVTGEDGQFTNLVRDPTGQMLTVDLPGETTLRSYPTLHGDLGLLRNQVTGSIAYSAIYEAFGTPTTTGSSPVPLGFQSMLTDPVTGLVDMDFRNYDPVSGRFAAADNIVGDLSRPVTLNRYTYANGNPVDYFDPDGHFSIGGVGDAFTSFFSNLFQTAGEAFSGVGQAISDGVSAFTSSTAFRQVADTVQHHVSKIWGDITQTVEHYVHNPEAALSMLTGIALGAATFVGCTIATAGAGTAGCAIAGFAVGGAITGALDCPPQQSVLVCAGIGAASGAVSGAVFSATGGLGVVAAGALSGAAGSATQQLLTSGSIDFDQMIAGGVIGGAAGGLARYGGRGLKTAAPNLWEAGRGFIERGIDRSNRPLFHGDTRTPAQIVDADGLQPKGTSNDLEAYVKYNEPSNFVSTTPSQSVARDYASKLPEGAPRDAPRIGWVYEVYPSNEAIKIRSRMPKHVWNYEKEMSIRGGIPLSEIKSAYQTKYRIPTGKTWTNPNFVAEPWSNPYYRR